MRGKWNNLRKDSVTLHADFNENNEELMPPLTYIHASEAARTTAGGGGVGGGRITPPRYGAQTCLVVCIIFPTGNE